MLNLFRVREFTPEELTTDLTNAVKIAGPTLRRRYHPGTLRRLGGEAEWVRGYVTQLILRDYTDDLDETGRATYAVVTGEDRIDGLKVVGLGTLDREVRSRRNRLPVPAGITRRLPPSWTGTDVSLAQFNVSAWTLPAYNEQLGHDVYGGLLSEASAYSTWTVEPLRSGSVFHNAIRQAGMTATGEAFRYDVGEDGHYVPPVSQAYARPALLG